MFCLSFSAACNALEQRYANQKDYYTSECCTILSTSVLATFSAATDLLSPEQAAAAAMIWSTGRIVAANTDCKKLDKLMRKAHVAAGSLLAFASPGPDLIKPALAAAYWVGSHVVKPRSYPKDLDQWRKNHQG